MFDPDAKVGHPGLRNMLVGQLTLVNYNSRYA
jgi:hypothetical protein